jgi:preprotein translocase subunit SecG
MDSSFRWNDKELRDPFRMFTFLLVVQTLIAAALVTVILMQRSEGGGLGVGGSSAGLMTARGAADFLTRATAILATLFVVLSIILAGMAAVERAPVALDTSLANTAPASSAPIAPAAPATGVPLAGEVPLGTAPLAGTAAPPPAPAPEPVRPAPRRETRAPAAEPPASEAPAGEAPATTNTAPAISPNINPETGEEIIPPESGNGN